MRHQETADVAQAIAKLIVEARRTTSFRSPEEMAGRRGAALPLLYAPSALFTASLYFAHASSNRFRVTCLSAWRTKFCAAVICPLFPPRAIASAIASCANILA